MKKEKRKILHTGLVHALFGVGYCPLWARRESNRVSHSFFIGGMETRYNRVDRGLEVRGVCLTW